MTDEHPNAALLRTLYQDLCRIGEFCTPDVRLHPAHRPGWVHRGPRAAWAHEKMLRRTGGLVMNVRHVYADDHFGMATGVMTLTKDPAWAKVFCGLWRFENGRIAEHWENDGPFLEPPT